jgi:hypothetical protein
MSGLFLALLRQKLAVDQINGFKIPEENKGKFRFCPPHRLSGVNQNH